MKSTGPTDDALGLIAERIDMVERARAAAVTDRCSPQRLQEIDLVLDELGAVSRKIHEGAQRKALADLADLGVKGTPILRLEYVKDAGKPPFDETMNEYRADRAEMILRKFSDRNGPSTDVSDVIANLIHFCDRAGLDWEEILDRSYAAYKGDFEDSPEAKYQMHRFTHD